MNIKKMYKVKKDVKGEVHTNNGRAKRTYVVGKEYPLDEQLAQWLETTDMIIEVVKARDKPKTEEIAAIKAELDKLGVSYYPNTGLKKLKAKLDRAKEPTKEEG